MRKLLITTSLFIVFISTIIADPSIKVICIGNSISQGKSKGSSLPQRSYRPVLWQKLDSAGYDVEFVGTNPYWFGEGTNLTNPSFTINLPASPYTGHTFSRYHECYYGINTDGFLKGISGGGHPTITDFATRLKAYNIPDIALIHIGTNNDNGGDATKVANIKTIITTLRARNPNIKIFLATLIDDWNTLNAEIPKIVSDMNTTASPVILVDQAEGINNDPAGVSPDTWDWVHPNDQGSAKMAQKWFNAIISTGDSEKPSTPTALVLKSTASNSFVLQWNASTDNIGISGYRVYGNDKLLGTFTTTTATVTGLTASTLYNVYVKAIDFGLNESDASQTIQVTTKAPSYTITFRVKNAANTFLPGVNVTFNDSTKQTNASGTVIFYEVLGGSKTYTAVFNTYQELTASLNVAGNVTRTLTLQLANSIPQNNIDKLSLYPTLFNESISYDGYYETGSIKIFDITGKKVLSANSFPINTSSIVEGIYLVQFVGIENKLQTFKLVKR